MKFLRDGRHFHIRSPTTNGTPQLLFMKGERQKGSSKEKDVRMSNIIAAKGRLQLDNANILPNNYESS